MVGVATICSLPACYPEMKILYGNFPAFVIFQIAQILKFFVWIYFPELKTLNGIFLESVIFLNRKKRWKFFLWTLFFNQLSHSHQSTHRQPKKASLTSSLSNQPNHPTQCCQTEWFYAKLVILKGPWLQKITLKSLALSLAIFEDDQNLLWRFSLFLGILGLFWTIFYWLSPHLYQFIVIFGDPEKWEAKIKRSST